MESVLADSHDRIRNLATNAAALWLPESGISARRPEQKSICDSPVLQVRFVSGGLVIRQGVRWGRGHRGEDWAGVWQGSGASVVRVSPAAGVSAEHWGSGIYGGAAYWRGKALSQGLRQRVISLTHCTRIPPPHYPTRSYPSCRLIRAQLSRSVVVRLNTGAPARESASTQKYPSRSNW